MRLFLVRHGESIDNVAGLYAGSRDSPLTSHGVLQARRLGDHLAARAVPSDSGPITHIFASDLKRAAATAQAVVDAVLVRQQEAKQNEEAGGQQTPSMVLVAELRERHFGSREGLKFGSATATGAVGSGVAEPPETRAEMEVRAERFIDAYLVPLLLGCREDMCRCVVVVAHGILLNVLLGCLLARFGPRGGERPDGYMASWSNTGYLEAKVRWESGEAAVSGKTTGRPEHGRIRLDVLAVNRVDHLQGLKKTRGGIGSAQFDSKQRTVDSFFKPRPKSGD
ncbi:hypothetical protein VTK73DRAFT_1462 [Phialemonium thermophilum]|uniref:Uncharacterized protein n=1 Tax=Phialemonium thermophilum TaxID=223376 RepID=A0ABR3X9F0_9PEZI